MTGLFLFISFLSASGVECLKIVDRVYQDNFYNPDVYKETKCVRNVDQLTKKLVEQGISIDKIKVVYLLYEAFQNGGLPFWFKGDLIPVSTRKFRLTYSWPMHTILEVEGKIVDLDYGYGKLLDVKEYFNGMFAASPSHPAGKLEYYIFMRAIPASEHRKIVDNLGGDDSKVAKMLGDRENSLSQYPIQTVHQYFSTHF